MIILQRNISKFAYECANSMGDVYKKMQECNPYRKLKVLIEFDDMIADILVTKT